MLSAPGQAGKGQESDRISLYDIVSRQQEHSNRNDDEDDVLGGSSLLADLGKFTVVTPNPYERSAHGGKGVMRKTVNIKMLDVLFDNQVCSLV